jgi:hypothetical protein
MNSVRIDCFVVIWQFFITLADNPASLKKLTNKYVNFGEIDTTVESHAACLRALNDLGDGKGGTKVPVWIDSLIIDPWRLRALSVRLSSITEASHHADSPRIRVAGKIIASLLC